MQNHSLFQNQNVKLKHFKGHPQSYEYSFELLHNETKHFQIFQCKNSNIAICNMVHAKKFDRQGLSKFQWELQN